MLVTFYCENCQAKLRITADAMGSALVCPECDRTLEVPRMQLGPGFVVGGFLIKHKLGEGGMGEVYLATQLSLERDVALKILPSRYTRENSFVVRFLKEVHYQAKLDHPNIVAAYDAGEDNGVYYMAMAYMAGETLEEWLEREGTLAEKDALQVVRQIAMALQYAFEEKGILHRDIKPANIMLTATLHAKVLDMGLSKNTFEKTSTTLADTLMGTPNYMSPEQIDHPQDIDTRSDLFSLGMSLYHMLTGQIPFEDTGYLKTLQRHAKEKLEDPRSLVPGISKASSRLLVRMLARDPDDRYSDWDAFLADLQQVMSHQRLPKLPEGESTLELAADPRPEPAQGPTPAETRSTPAPANTRSLNGVILSICLGLLLGITAVFLIAPRLADTKTEQNEIGRPPPAPPDPDPEPTPEPEPTEPPEDLSALQRELSTIILTYERDRNQHDELLRELVDLGTRASGTPVSEAAAEQIVRIRRDRDEAVENARKHLRENTIRLLYEKGPEPARDYIAAYDSPFKADLDGLADNLRRRIRIWEKQERSQREAEAKTAADWLQELRRQLVSPVLKREWTRAVHMVDQAAEEPSLFPVADDLAGLRRELLALQAVPERILESYSEQLHEEITLSLLDRTLRVQIKEVQDGGLLVVRTLYDDDGHARGSAELFIPFSNLSSTEINSRLRKLEGSRFLFYRALLAQRSGDRDASRRLLEECGTPLALTLRDELFALPSIPPAREAFPSTLDSPLNTPRFVPLPTFESP
ncbi:MAG: protein kinase [Kiritimatiellia bacterium]